MASGKKNGFPPPTSFALLSDCSPEEYDGPECLYAFAYVVPLTKNDVIAPASLQ